MISPRLDGDERVEVEENGQNSEGVSCGRPPKLQALSLYYVLVRGVSFQATENATKTQNTTLNTYGKLSLFILFYIVSTFGITTCKILSFMKHFYRSLESSRERALRNTVNVWDHMSRCLEQFGWSACAYIHHR